jgi:hypothetical protein
MTSWIYDNKNTTSYIYESKTQGGGAVVAGNPIGLLLVLTYAESGNPWNYENKNTTNYTYENKN